MFRQEHEATFLKPSLPATRGIRFLFVALFKPFPDGTPAASSNAEKARRLRVHIAIARRELVAASCRHVRRRAATNIVGTMRPAKSNGARLEKKRQARRCVSRVSELARNFVDTPARVIDLSRDRLKRWTRVPTLPHSVRHELVDPSRVVLVSRQCIRCRNSVGGGPESQAPSAVYRDRPSDPSLLRRSFVIGWERILIRNANERNIPRITLFSFALAFRSEASLQTPARTSDLSGQRCPL